MGQVQVEIGEDANGIGVLAEAVGDIFRMKVGTQLAPPGLSVDGRAQIGEAVFVTEPRTPASVRSEAVS